MFLMILKSFFGYKNYCRDCRYYQPPNWYCLNKNFDTVDKVTGTRSRRMVHKVKQDFCIFWEKK